MATTHAVAATGTKNDSGKVLHAGNIASSRWSNLSLDTNLDPAPMYGSKVILADGSPGQSGIGTDKAIDDGTFAQMPAGYYVGKVINTQIAGIASTFLRSGAAQTSSRRSLHYGRGNRRYDITGWSYTTGAATYGANRGEPFTYINVSSGAALTHEAFPTNAVPGELVYMNTGKTPTQDDYKPITG